MWRKIEPKKYICGEKMTNIRFELAARTPMIFDPGRRDVSFMQSLTATLFHKFLNIQHKK